MSKKNAGGAVVENAPTGDALTPDEQKFFDSRGGESDPAAQPTPPDAAAPADGASATPATPEPAKTVPLSALHEEREQRKALAKELAAEREARRRLDERTNEILKRFGEQPAAPPQPPKTEAPDITKDPLLAFAHTLDEHGKALREWQQERQTRQQETEAQATIRQIVSQATELEREFVTENPDYNEASQFLNKSRSDELQMLGYSPFDIRAQLQQEALALAAQAIQRGRNPAELIYGLAKQRGWAPKPPQADPAKPNGTPPANDAAAKHLATVRRGQAESASISAVPGTGPIPKSAKQLLDMSEAEFAQAMNDPAWRALMG